MYVLNTLRLCTFVCASILYLWRCPCIQCHTMEPTTNSVITQKSTSLYLMDGQPKSLYKMTAVDYIYSSSTKQNVLTGIGRNVIEPSFTDIAQENTDQNVVFTSSPQDSMTLLNEYIRPILVTSAVSHNPLDAMSTTAAIHARTELTTVSADIMQQHSLPELSTPFYKLKSPGLTDQVTSTGILNAEHITAYPHVTEFLTLTVEPARGGDTPSSSSYQQDVTTTTTSAVDSTVTSFMTESSREKSLVVTKLNAKSGYITTPGFDEGMEYPNRMNDTHCISINSSEGQVLLLTFHFFDLEKSYGGKCRYDYLQLSVIGSDNTKYNMWKKCGRQSVSYRVFNQSHVCLQFFSDYIVESKGFKATFSILPKSKGRYQLEGGFFNCSAITSNQRSEHFDCNLVTECSKKQDESNCSYSSSDCPGLVDAGSQRYTVILLSNITWADARNECRSLHQTLVSPNTPGEWQNFTKVMSGKGIVAYVGLHLTRSSAEVPSMYRNIWAWDAGNTAFYVQLDRNYYFWYSVPSCALLVPETSNSTLFAVSCDQARDALVVCQTERKSKSQEPEIPIPSLQTTNSSFSIKTEKCSGGFFVHAFLSCDPESHCHDDVYQEECLKKASTPNIEMFECQHSKLQSVHYTLVCDFKPDCRDFSDESFCIHDTCPEDRCLNGQCIKSADRCDGMVHCVDGSDENCPGHFDAYYLGSSNQAVPPPAMITLGGRGSFEAVPLNDSCPSSHFQCNDLYCLPSYLRCNGVSDCTDHEDENEDCETETKAVCRGFFRCRKSKVCVHPENVCDGVFHCPQRDDEMLCNAQCPQGCTCQGLAFACNSTVSINNSYSQLRYLEIRDADVSRVDLSKFTYLVLLRLSNCGLKEAPKVAHLQNLRTLDLRNNELANICLNSFMVLHNLYSLVLSGNPLQSISPSADKIATLQNVDLSKTELLTIDSTNLSSFPSVKVLNMSQSALTTVTGKAFNATADLRVVDFRGAPLISYPNDMLRSLHRLREVYADDFRLCCKGALHEHFIGDMCHAPQDSIASCDDLLRSKMYRVFLWVVASIALFGNAGSFVTRCFLQGELRQSSFMMFVTNLSLADFLMGVYLVIVGVADLSQSEYWKKADNWKRSPACKVAGFLSILSSEVSAFFICLITVDRFLVLRFPFSRFHFSHRSTLVACAVAWTVGLVLAAVPLLPWTERWNLYGQTGICIPLPFARRDTFDGYMYSFSVMIVLNFTMFLLIAVGQASIYLSVRASELTQIRKSTKSKDAVIARRLLTIVLSDFFCWFPIGVLGLLAYTGIPIHPEISVAVAVFVMPFNSALNPFLYTFNMLMEKRRLATEERILQRLKSQLQSMEWHQANSTHSITEGQCTDSRGSRLSLTAQ